MQVLGEGLFAENKVVDLCKKGYLYLSWTPYWYGV